MVVVETGVLITVVEDAGVRKVVPVDIGEVKILVVSGCCGGVVVKLVFLEVSDLTLNPPIPHPLLEWPKKPGE